MSASSSAPTTAHTSVPLDAKELEIFQMLTGRVMEQSKDLQKLLTEYSTERKSIEGQGLTDEEAEKLDKLEKELNSQDNTHDVWMQKFGKCLADYSNVTSPRLGNPTGKVRICYTNQPDVSISQEIRDRLSELQGSHAELDDVFFQDLRPSEVARGKMAAAQQSMRRWLTRYGFFNAASTENEPSE